MMVFSHKQILALEAVIDVALYARPEPVQARDITARQNVPQRYLEQIMQALVRGDILRGVRGPKGGYRLARERRRIMVGDIIRIITQLEKAEHSERQKQALNGAGLAQDLCSQMAQDMMDRLDKISIAALCETIYAQTPNHNKTADFTI